MSRTNKATEDTAVFDLSQSWRTDPLGQEGRKEEQSIMGTDSTHGPGVLTGSSGMRSAMLTKKECMAPLSRALDTVFKRTLWLVFGVSRSPKVNNVGWNHSALQDHPGPAKPQSLPRPPYQ